MTNKNRQTTEPPIHIAETSAMLKLGVAQIHALLSDSDQSLNGLTEGFTDMIQHVKEIAKALNHQSHSCEIDNLRLHCDAVEQKINRSIVNFQFYDFMSQRLNQLAKMLSNTDELVNSLEEHDQRQAWTRLQQQIRSQFISEADKRLFDELILEQPQTDSVAVDNTGQQAVENSGPDIELF